MVAARWRAELLARATRQKRLPALPFGVAFAQCSAQISQGDEHGRIRVVDAALAYNVAAQAAFGNAAVLNDVVGAAGVEPATSGV